MKKLLLRLLIMALPVAVFWVVVQTMVMQLFHVGDVSHALVYVFGGVLIIAVWEGVAFRAWVLPFIGRVFSASVYGGSYSAQDDPLLTLAARIRSSKDTSLLPEFLALVEQDKGRARVWSELAALYDDTFHNLPESLAALLQGAQHADSAQDRAMFLYRAAKMRQSRMGDFAGARELYALAASRYPRTAYGRKAARME
ncbi:MAG: hypothetical protein IKL98_02185 [Akkermansia sp.]|nr:hypothetical protein [Akkermansia sp.]